MTLDCFASESHYAEHLAPIAAAIPGARLLCADRRTFEAGMKAMLRLPGALNGKLHTQEVPDYNSTDPILVASYRDLLLSPQGRRIALLEHGAGQTYLDAPDSPFYPGGAHHDRCTLILSPGPHSARRWRTAYPNIPVVELKGSPRLDPWTRPCRGAPTCWCGTPPHERCPNPPRNKGPDEAAGTGGMGQAGARPVAVSFHWHCSVAKETEATWPFWQSAVEVLAKGRPVVGHAHPRLWGTLQHWYAKAGIEAVSTFDELLDRCAGGLLACDNSSIMYEWAGLGWPVLCLDEPRLYRREVEHGLRFWSHMPGMGVSTPWDLGEAVEWTLGMGADRATEYRDSAVLEAYGGYFDGQATERAVAAIEEHLL